MKIISVEGIVVSSTPFKESSKILKIFTKDKGIIGCVSKGCKNMKSKLRLPSERFAYGTFHLYYKEEGLSTLIDGDIKDYFVNIKSDILRVSYLTYICELSVKVYEESLSDEVYPLMESAILKLEDTTTSKKLFLITSKQKASIVQILALLSSTTCFLNLVSKGALSISLYKAFKILSLISEAAAFVKVTTNILSISTPSSIIFLIILSTNTAVLPLPAAAATKILLPLPVIAAS